MFKTTFQQYRDFIMADNIYLPENAEKITKVPTNQIRQAAKMLTKPKPNGNQTKTSLMLEKNNY